MNAYDSEIEMLEERRGTFKRGDLYKMHTYRDAIPRASSAWILYPGTEFRHFPAVSPPGALVEAAATEGLTGVGAIPLMPGDLNEGPLGEMLRRLLETPTF